MPDTKETFPRPPSNEQTLLTELGEVKRQMKNQGNWIIRMRDALSEMSKERDTLQKFKDWVHGYLDDHGVPHHPPGPHGAEGCRIGDRMDWLMAKLANAEQSVDHIAAEVKADSEEIYRHLEHCRIERDALKAELAESKLDMTEREYYESRVRMAEEMSDKTLQLFVKSSAERDALAVTATKQAEQIRRLRESLEWALKQRLSTWCCQDHERARAILKETAPPA